MTRRSSHLYDLLLALFPFNAGLLEFLANYDYAQAADLTNSLPDANVPRTTYARSAVEQIQAHGLDGSGLFDRLVQRFPGQSDLIGRAKQAHLAEGDTAATRGPTRKALLRALLPFEDGDELVGRDSEIQDLVTIVTSAEFHFGVVWGPTGCGKTSLLRAGLLPRLRLSGLEPIYLPRPADELLTQLELSLAPWNSAPGWNATQAPSDGATTPANGAAKPIIVVIDQAEEFFLRHKARLEHARLADFLSRSIGSRTRRISILVGIREDFFGKLHYLSPGIPDPTQPKNCYELEELTVDAAKDVLCASLDTDRTQFDGGLIAEIVHDLATDGRVRPAELQIVATSLKRRRIKQQNAYGSIGGARGVLRSYIQDEIAAGSNKQMASLILRRLCAQGRPVKSPTDVSEDEIAGEIRRAGLDVGPDMALLRATLRRLLDARLIVQTDQSLYNLVHDYIAPLVILATAGIETETEKANRLIQKYVAEYNDDPKFRIPRRHLRLIGRHADRTHLTNPKTKRLLYKSVRTALGQVLLPPAAVVAAALTASYAFLFFTEYLSTAPATFNLGRPSIVVRAGHPILKFLPGFDHVLVDTGYSMLDVSEENPEGTDAIPRENLAQFKWATVNGHSAWADDLVRRLAISQRVIAQRLLGNIDLALESASEPLSKGDTRVSYSVGLTGATADPETTDRIVERLREMVERVDTPEAKITVGVSLGQIFQGRTDQSALAAAYREAFKAYMDLTLLPEPADRGRNLSWELSKFEQALRSLVTAMPSLVNEQDTRALLDLRANPKFDPFRSWSVLRTLATMATANPSSGAAILRGLIAVVAAEVKSGRSGGTGWLTTDTIRTLVTIAESLPELITAEALAALAEMIGPGFSSVPVIAYGLLAGHNLAAVSPETMKSVQACAREGGGDSEGRVRGDACALTLVRLGKLETGSSSEAADALRRALASETKYTAWSARRIVLTSPGQNASGFSVESRASFFKQNIQVDHVDSPQRYEHDDGYLRFYQAAAANTNLVQDDNVLSLIEIMETSNLSGANTEAARTLLAAARWRPSYVLSQRVRLNKLPGKGFDETADAAMLHSLVLAALARADYEAKKISSPPSLLGILSLLETRGDSEQRTYGAYAAYLFWLDRTSERAALERELRSLAARPEPDLRMIANQALEMIWVGRLTLIDTISNPPSLARARLGLLTGHPEPHIASAARISMEKWISDRSARTTKG